MIINVEIFDNKETKPTPFKTKTASKTSQRQIR